MFLEIHPFQDGNGRLSRVLTRLLLLQAGYAYVPYSSLESVVEQNKEAYYLRIVEARAGFVEKPLQQRRIDGYGVVIPVDHSAFQPALTCASTAFTLSTTV